MRVAARQSPFDSRHIALYYVISQDCRDRTGLLTSNGRADNRDGRFYLQPIQPVLSGRNHW